MIESKMKNLIENYYTNLTLLTELQNKAVEYDVKITASYSLNGGGGSGFNSKTENLAVKLAYQKENLKEIEQKILIVDESIKILDQKEKEVIEKVKIYKNKLNIIARELRVKKKYVYDTRNRAIKKMCEYIGGKNKYG